MRSLYYLRDFLQGSCTGASPRIDRLHRLKLSPLSYVTSGQFLDWLAAKRSRRKNALQVH